MNDFLINSEYLFYRSEIEFLKFKLSDIEHISVITGKIYISTIHQNDFRLNWYEDSKFKLNNNLLEYFDFPDATLITKELINRLF